MAEARISYVICTTARSGSNLVCDYLARTRLLGRPTEFFNPDIVRKGAYGYTFPFGDSVAVGEYVAWLRSTFSSGNGVFGVKMLFEDFEHLSAFSAVQNLIKDSVILRLSRRKKLSQAVSYLMAMETGQWIASDPPQKQPEEVLFDFDRIQKYLDMLAHQDARWDAILDSLGKATINWTFEDFTRDPRAHVGDLAEAVGVDLGSKELTTGLVPQATARSQVLIAQFRSEFASRLPQSDRSSYGGLDFAP